MTWELVGGANTIFGEDLSGLARVGRTLAVLESCEDFWGAPWVDWGRKEPQIHPCGVMWAPDSVPGEAWGGFKWFRDGKKNFGGAGEGSGFLGCSQGA